MTGKSKQRNDADNAFLKVQTKTSVRSRVLSEIEVVNQARDANTARLKALRLEKEALDREALAAAPEPKRRRSKSP